MRVTHKTFAALAGPFHRTADLAGGPGDDGLFRVVVDFGAETAADVGGDDPQLVLRDVQHVGAHQQPDHMRVLAGGVEGEVGGGGIEVAERDAGLHRVWDQPVVGQVQFHDLGSAGEDAIDHGLIANHPIVADVACHTVMHLDRVGLDGIGQVRDSGQVGVVDFQQFRGILRFLLRLRDHDGNRVADMPHLADRDHRMRRLRHWRTVLVVDLPAARDAAHALGRHVAADEHPHHARCRRRGGRVDAVDRGVRAVGPLDVGVKLAGPVDVVCIVALAAQEANVLLAANGCADAFESHGRYPLCARGAYSAALACISGCAAAIAFTMLW